MNLPSRAFVAACAAIAVLAGCNGAGGTRGGSLPKPDFSTLEIPNPAGGWMTYSTSSPPPEVLPTRGRSVRIWFYAPVGSTFDVSLRALDGTITVLADSHGNPVPAEAGFYQVVSVNVALNPPLYTMQVRPPMSLPDQGNFDILVVNKSLRTDVTDSPPMVVALRQRKVFTVSVGVIGDGHVTSTPAGIQCGTSPSGAVLSPCSYDFGPGQVSLAPGSNNLSTTKFVGWSGNCMPGVQVCGMTLDGMSAQSAVATFGASSGGTPGSTCPVAPQRPGWRWVNIPACASGNIAGHPGISLACDSQGYFCCEPGPSGSNAPRCGGAGKILSVPDCRNDPKQALFNPGGCYEVNSAW